MDRIKTMPGARLTTLFLSLAAVQVFLPSGLQAQTTQTIATAPPGLVITVDSATCTTPCSYAWTTGSTHSVVAAGPQSGATGIRYVFSAWSDGGTATHNVTGPSTPTTYTANFTTQYQLNTSVSPPAGGSIIPATGAWYNNGSIVAVTATAASTYRFTNYSGDLSGATNPQNLTMNAPKNVAAYFGGATTQNYSTAGSYTWTAPAGVYSVVAQLWGAGGSGGGGFVDGSGNAYSGGGGGGGGYSQTSTISVNPGASYTIVVGGGGAAGNGSPGGASTAWGFSAAGGNGGGGGGQTAEPGGTGGSGSTGTGGAGASGSVYYAQWYCYDFDPYGNCQGAAYIAVAYGGNGGSGANGGSGGSGGSYGYNAPGYSGAAVGGGGGGGSATYNYGYYGVDAAAGGSGAAGQVSISYAASSAPLVTQIITSTPAGLSLTVDGALCTTPCAQQWNAGTSHTISAPVTVAGGSGSQYAFANWSDAGAAAHTIAPSTATTIMATYNAQFQLVTNAAPSIGGTITPGSGNWYNAGTAVSLGETPAAGFTFVNYGNSGGNLSGNTLTMSAPATVTANFTAPPANNTITSSPAGLTVTVDSGTCVTPCTYSWNPASTHTIAAAGPQAGTTGTQYLYSNWADGGTATHSVPALGVASTFTANFTTQYYLTTAGSPSAGGSLTPANGWYNSGATVAVTGVPASAYRFTNFTTDLTGTANPQNIVMNAPRNVTGYFGGAITQTFSTAGTYTWTVPAGVVAVQAQVWGGGGGGGSGWLDGANNSYGGGGGGGGGYSAVSGISVLPGASYTVVVGAAGVGGWTGGATGGSGSAALGYTANGGGPG